MACRGAVDGGGGRKRNNCPTHARRLYCTDDWNMRIVINEQQSAPSDMARPRGMDDDDRKPPT